MKSIAEKKLSSTILKMEMRNLGALLGVISGIHKFWMENINWKKNCFEEVLGVARECLMKVMKVALQSLGLKSRIWNSILGT